MNFESLALMQRVILRPVAVLAVVGSALVQPPAAQAGPECAFQLGFAELRALIPDEVGECLENERRNPINGNSEQRTTGGLLVWRRADNWTAFTNGALTWLNGPDGVEVRLNEGPLFAWEAELDLPSPPVTLVEDSFDDPARASLPAVSQEPTRYERGYNRGEYFIRKIDPSWEFTPTAELRGIFSDAALAIDARLIGDVTGRYVMLACRGSPATDAHYRLGVQPANGRFELSRWGNGRRVALVGWRESAAIKRGNATNRLELDCQGSSIKARVNGLDVASIDDSSFSSGQFWIGAGTFSDVLATAEARFDNLRLSGRAAG